MAGERGRDGSKGATEGSLSVIAKEFVAGGVAGGVAKSAVAPLERVKILFQTRRAEFQSVGLLGSFRKIVQSEGLLGFYRGNGASVARIVPYAALHYMAYEQYRRWIILCFPDMGRGPVLDLVSGSIAGGTAVIMTYPLDLVRTRLAYQVTGSSKLKFGSLSQSEQIYRGIFDCILKIYRQNGIRGLYRGVGPSLYGIFPYSGLKFYFYEEMKSHVTEEHKNDIIVKLGCGSVAGLLGQTITYPLDVVRRQMQVEALSVSNHGVGKGTFESLVRIVQTQGWRQLFSGLSINYLKMATYSSSRGGCRGPSRLRPPRAPASISQAETQDEHVALDTPGLEDYDVPSNSSRIPPTTASSTMRYVGQRGVTRGMELSRITKKKMVNWHLGSFVGDHSISALTWLEQVICTRGPITGCKG